MRLLSRLNVVGDTPGREDARLWAATAMAKVRANRRASRLLRLAEPASLFGLYKQAEIWTPNAATFVETVTGRAVDPAWEVEYEHAEQTVNERITEFSHRFPTFYAVEDESRRALYFLTRAIRPERLLEIGVADGVSTCYLLAALEANGSGTLVSIDVDPGAGGLVVSDARWQLRIIDGTRSRDELRAISRSLEPLDLVFHDARHDYEGQYGDFLAFEPSLGPEATVLCDDAESSHAFTDFAGRQHAPYSILFDHRKALGGFQRGE
ncbi:MAG: class I SAM-dependent methyltransferase [Acidimicrobiales bacterium]|jgi:predicted O-methyltransferase YrrM|nr:class I SAM-dependent methyltransferase [Acidimicrobiales bacterium]